MNGNLEAPFWLQFVQPFGTVIIGIGVFVITQRQYQVNSEKLRIDLLQIRIAIITGISYFIRKYDDNAALSTEDYIRLSELTLRARTVFDLKQVYKLQFDVSRTSLSAVQDSMILTSYVNPPKRTDIIDGLVHLLKLLIVIMATALFFSEIDKYMKN